MSATASESPTGRAVVTGDDATPAGDGGAPPTPEVDPTGATAGGDAAPVAVEIVAITVVAALAGTALRFTTRSALWLDEALSVNIAELPLGEITGALRQDGHPPLYYVLLHGWIRVVGDTDGAVRSLSGLIAVAALPLAYLAGRRMGGRVLGCIALGVFALTPFMIRYGTEARMYSLMSLLVLVGYLLTDDLVRRNRHDWWRVVALALTVAGLLWTHYWGMWVVAALAVVLLWSWRRADRPDVRAGAARALIGIVAGGVLFVPWVPTLLFQSAHTGTPWAGPVRPVTFLSMTFSDISGVGFLDAHFVGGALLVLVLLGAFGRAVDTRRIELDLLVPRRVRPEVAVLVLTMGFGLLVTYLTWSTYASRYAAVFAPLLLLLAAAGISRFTGRWLRAGLYVVVLLLLAMGGVYNIVYERTQVADVAPVLAERTVPGDVVVTCPDQLGPATLRVAPDGLVVVGYPGLTTPDRIDWADYADRQDVDLDAYAADLVDLAGPDHTVAMVWSTTYVTHEGRCEALFDALARLRPAETVVNQDGSKYYESANLSFFSPAP